MNQKQKRWIVKSVIAICLMGLVYCLFLSDSTEYEVPGLETHFPEKSLESEQPITVPEDGDQDEIPLLKKDVASEPPISEEEDRDRFKPPNKGSYFDFSVLGSCCFQVFLTGFVLGCM